MTIKPITSFDKENTNKSADGTDSTCGCEINGLGKDRFSSHNDPCFQCNISIGRSTVHMYSYAKILKHG